jgi:hypothetical protein
MRVVYGTGSNRGGLKRRTSWRAAVFGMMTAWVWVPPPNAAGDARLLLNGTPARTGDFKPADIQSLVISNGLLSITLIGSRWQTT